MALTRTLKLLAAGAAAAAAVAVTPHLVASSGRGDGPSAVARTALRHESLIADCMHGRGFDYAVALPRDVTVEEVRRAAVRQHRDPKAAMARAEASAPPDPNRAVVGALPPDRQQAWGDALYGDDGWPGCYYATYERAWGESLDRQAQQGETLAARVRADPAVRVAERTYLDCMAARGYRVSGTDDVYRLIGEAGDRLDAAGAEEYEKAANAAHTTCLAPYQNAYDTAYLRLAGHH
jgi:hypothetical protein